MGKLTLDPSLQTTRGVIALRGFPSPAKAALKNCSGGSRVV